MPIVAVRSREEDERRQAQLLAEGKALEAEGKRLLASKPAAILEPRDPKYDAEIVIPIASRQFDVLVRNLKHSEQGAKEHENGFTRLRDYDNAISFKELGFRLVRSR